MLGGHGAVRRPLGARVPCPKTGRRRRTGPRGRPARRRDAGGTRSHLPADGLGSSWPAACSQQPRCLSQRCAEAVTQSVARIAGFSEVGGRLSSRMRKPTRISGSWRKRPTIARRSWPAPPGSPLRSPAGDRRNSDGTSPPPVGRGGRQCAPRHPGLPGARAEDVRGSRRSRFRGTATVTRLAEAARARGQRARPGTLLLTAEPAVGVVLRGLRRHQATPGRRDRAPARAGHPRSRPSWLGFVMTKAGGFGDAERADPCLGGVRVSRPVLGPFEDGGPGRGRARDRRALADREVRQGPPRRHRGRARHGRGCRVSGLDLRVQALTEVSEATFAPDRIEVLDLANADPGAFVVGRVSACCRARGLRPPIERGVRLAQGRSPGPRRQGGTRRRGRPPLGRAELWRSSPTTPRRTPCS